MLLTLGLDDGDTWSQDSFRVLSLTLSEMSEGERAKGGNMWRKMEWIEKRVFNERQKGEEKGEEWGGKEKN